MAVSALVNVVVSARLRAVARRTGSPAVEGEAAHLSSDVWTSAGTAAGLVLVAVTGWEWLDAVVGLLVAAYVVWVGGRLLWRAVQVLLDRALPDDERDVIEGVLDGLHRRRGQLPRAARPARGQQAPRGPPHGRAARDDGAQRATS